MVHHNGSTVNYRSGCVDVCYVYDVAVYSDVADWVVGWSVMVYFVIVLLWIFVMSLGSLLMMQWFVSLWWYSGLYLCIYFTMMVMWFLGYVIYNKVKVNPTEQ